jgi:GNAT superfamily N-acetyltransferase
MLNSDLRVRVMTVDDLPFADSLRALAGWNQTLRDWQRFLARAPDGCFVAQWDTTPIGTVTTICYGSDLAWIGMMLVHPDFRGRGAGTALMRHALVHLNNRGIRCIKLDATPLGRSIYERLGFRAQWALTRWQRNSATARFPGEDPTSVGSARGPRAASGGSPDASTTASKREPPEVSASRRNPHAGGVCSPPCNGARQDQNSGSAPVVRALAKANWPALVRLDTRAFGVAREPLLRQMVAESQLALTATNEAGDLTGYAMLRDGVRADYIGPLVARDAPSAGALVQTLISSHPTREIFWDIPDANSAAVELAKKSSFEPQRPLQRMAIGRDEQPGNPLLQFAIADPATG